MGECHLTVRGMAECYLEHGGLNTDVEELLGLIGYFDAPASKGHHLAKIGGLEELLRCLMMITYADADKLTRYLAIYDNCFLWQKVGYILSHFPNMKLPVSFFDTCKANARKNVRYLYEDIKKESPVFESEWGLYVPKDMMKLLES